MTPKQRKRYELDRAHKKLARHVVKFADGWYLGVKLTHDGRVPSQRKAQRFLTWASAKMIADCTRFKGTGAHAVRLMPVAWMAVQLTGELVCMGGTKKQALELWKPELNPGTRLLKYAHVRKKTA